MSVQYCIVYLVENHNTIAKHRHSPRFRSKRRQRVQEDPGAELISSSHTFRAAWSFVIVTSTVTMLLAVYELLVDVVYFAQFDTSRY
jgi:hypothetical protein